MSLAATWTLAEALHRRLGQLCDPTTRREAAELGLNGPGWTLLLRAHLLAPLPISAECLGGFYPAVNPWTYEAGLQHLTALGLLEGAEGGAYTLTAVGQSALTSLLYTSYACLRLLAPQSAETLERLAELLEPLVSACLLAPAPPRKTLLLLSHELTVGAPPDAMVRVQQSLADLAAYHDEAQLAAWQPHMVSGPAWDALSVVWRGTPGTLEAVCEKLARRGWPRETYARALQELVRCDWVAGPEPYTLTPQGRVVRERADAQAAAYFFGPWQVLDPRACQELEHLLQQLTAALDAA